MKIFVNAFLYGFYQEDSFRLTIDRLIKLFDTKGYPFEIMVHSTLRDFDHPQVHCVPLFDHLHDNFHFKKNNCNQAIRFLNSRALKGEEFDLVISLSNKHPKILDWVLFRLETVLGDIDNDPDRVWFFEKSITHDTTRQFESLNFVCHAYVFRQMFYALSLIKPKYDEGLDESGLFAFICHRLGIRMRFLK